ncbi:MAG TPA: alpha/beta fold hydrolase [Candidatus Dormibacteraeota bacterium]
MREFVEHWIERAGVRLRVLEWPVLEPDQADGTELLLLHGLSSNARYWERLSRRFPHRRLVALDQRSHGRSDRPPSGYEMAELTADAAAVVSELGMRRPAVAGHSWGATVALELAATEPAQVSGLAVIDGPVAPISERMTWEDAARLMQPPLPRYRSLAEAYATQKTYLGEAWADDLELFVEDMHLRDADAWVLTLTADVRLQILRELFSFQPQLLWPQVAAPAFVALAGADSGMRSWKEAGARAVAELAPEADIRWYDSDHDIPLIRADELAVDVERFCLRAGLYDVARAVAELDGDWSRPAPMEGWSAKDLLAHLSSTQAAMPAVIRAVPEPVAPGGSREPFDSDRWNASQLRRRMERSPAELGAEVGSAGPKIDIALREVDLSREMAAGTFAGWPVDAGMRAMLRHQREHLEQLRATL